MSFRSDRYRIETARPEDAAQILEILEEEEFQGTISLLFSRRPDPYASFMREGREVTIIVARDTLRDRLVGIGAASINKMFVNGEAIDIGYLFGLRIRKEYRRRYLFLPYGFSYLFDLHRDKQIPFYITTILEENLDAQRLFEKRRATMPVYRYVDDYVTYIFAAGGKARMLPDVHFRRAEPSDGEALVSFLSEQGRRYQFFPVLDRKELDRRQGHISVDDFYLLCDRVHGIVAAGTLWDQRDYKQYILKGYAGALKVLYPFSFLLPRLGYPRLAPPGSVLNLCTLSFWVVKDDNARWCECFLSHMVQEARGFSYVVAGLDARHPLRLVFDKRPHLTYKSRMYLVYNSETGREPPYLDPGRSTYLEIGRL